MIKWVSVLNAKLANFNVCEVTLIDMMCVNFVLDQQA